MPAFNIEKKEFKSKCGIKEEQIRDIIEDSFPVGDRINFADVANKIKVGLKDLGYIFNVYVAYEPSHEFGTNCGICISCGEFIKYKVKYDGEWKAKNNDMDTPGSKYLVMIWK